jgi:hypothetical protein
MAASRSAAEADQAAVPTLASVFDHRIELVLDTMGLLACVPQHHSGLAEHEI